MRLPLALLAATLMTSVATAGPIADFNQELAGAYARYRMVLFKTNQGDAPASTKLIGEFAEAWRTLDSHWRATPPPQFSEDAGWSGTLDEVAALAGRATEEIAAGKLPEAHETLEHVRDAVSTLNARNGIVTFSDRMNDFHAQMERVLRTGHDNPANPAALTGDTAVLAFLAGQLMARAPAALAADTEFTAAIDAIVQSVNALSTAIASGDKTAVDAALSGLRKPYAQAIVKYG